MYQARGGVTLVYIGQFDHAAGHLLHLFGQRGDLFAIPLIGRGDGQRQQVPERVDRDVDLRSLTPRFSIAARMTAEVFWITSKLSVSRAALPWYRWM